MSKKEKSLCTGTLAVSGIGEIKVPPDTAWIQLGVSTRGKSAQQAIRENAEFMTGVINRIKQLGIADENFQTSGPTVSPVIQEQEGPDKGKIIGYAAENYLTVRARAEQAGSVFDEGIAAGANQSSSMFFGLADEGAARKAAFGLAVQSAHEQAQILAKAASVRLGQPRSIENSGIGSRMRASFEAKSANTPVYPGLVTVSAQVEVVYEYLYKGMAQEHGS